jgi:hypothetical protein
MQRKKLTADDPSHNNPGEKILQGHTYIARDKPEHLHNILLTQKLHTCIHPAQDKLVMGFAYTFWFHTMHMEFEKPSFSLLYNGPLFFTHTGYCIPQRTLKLNM